MLVDTISKVNNITFDSTNLSAYVTSLRGLSETQARVVLSSTSLDKVQKQQILNKIAETNATVSLTSAEATEALTRNLGSKEAANELLVKSGLVTKEQLLAGTTIEVTSAKIADAVATGVLTKEEGLKISTAFGLTGANIGLGTSFKLLALQIWESVKAMAAWLFTNPAGWATLAITAIVGAVAAYNEWGATLENTREKLEDLKSECDTIASDLSSVNSELKTTKQRMDELEGKGTLTFTEKEEYDNLVKQNNELQRTIDLLELEQKQKNKEKNKTFVDTIEKDVNDWDEYSEDQTGKYKKGHTHNDEEMGNGARSETDYIEYQFKQRQKLLDDLANAETLAEQKRIQEQIDKINKYLSDRNKQFKSDADGIEYIQNPTNDDEKAVNAWLDYINDFQDKMAIAMGGDNAKENAFNRLVDNWKFDEALNPLQKLGKEGKVTLEELKKRMSDPVFAEFVNKLKDIGFISDTTDGSLRFLASAFNGVTTSAKQYISTLKDEKAIDNFIKNIDEEAKAFGTTKDELIKLIGYHLTFNDTGLKADDKIAVLNTLAEKAGNASLQMRYLLQLFNLANGNVSSLETSDANHPEYGATDQEKQRRIQAAKRELNNIFSDIPEAEIPEPPPYTPGGGDKSGSNGRDKDADPLKADIDRYVLLQNAVDEAEQSLKRLESTEEGLHGSDKLKNIEQQAEAYERIAQAYNDMAWENKQERNDIRWRMEQQGFVFSGDFDSTNLSTNYSSHLQAMYDKYNAMPYKTEADKDSRAKFLETIKDMEDGYKRILALNKEVYDNENKSIDALKGHNKEIQNQRQYWEDYVDDQIADIEHRLEVGETLGTLSLDDKLAAYQRMKDIAHQRANDWRALGYDDNSEEVQKWQKAWLDADKNIRDTTEGRSDDLIENIEHALEVGDALGTLSLDDKLSAYQQMKDIAHQRADEWRAAGFDDNSPEVQKWQKAWLDADAKIKDAFNDTLDKIERATKKETDRLQELADEVGKLAEKYEALKQVKSSQFDFDNSMVEALQDIDNQLATSLVSAQYLDPDERGLIFNEEDYKLLSDKIKELQEGNERDAQEYWNKINDLGEDELYLKESITAEYERQLALKNKELEVYKAEVDVKKKEQALNNVLAEKNVKMLVDGRWTWVADADKVRQATEEANLARNRLTNVQIQKDQQLVLNGYDESIANANAEKAAYEQHIENINDAAKKMREAYEDYIDPVEDIGSLVEQLRDKGVSGFAKALNDLTSAMGGSRTSYSSGSKTTFTKDELADADISGLFKKKKGYASGTKFASPGWHKVDENGQETYVSDDGVFHNFAGGELVFNNDQVQRLFEFSKYAPQNMMAEMVSKYATPMINLPVKGAGGGNITYQFNGGIHIDEVADYNDFMLQLTQKANAIHQITKNE